MAIMECVVRKQIRDACASLLAGGIPDTALGLALAQSLGALIPPIQETSDYQAAMLMGRIRSCAARHLSRRIPARRTEDPSSAKFSSMIPADVDEDAVIAAFSTIQEILEAALDQETDDDLLDFVMLGESLVEVLVDLDLPWLTTPRLSALMTKARETDESIEDDDWLLEEAAPPSRLN